MKLITAAKKVTEQRLIFLNYYLSSVFRCCILRNKHKKKTTLLIIILQLSVRKRKLFFFYLLPLSSLSYNVRWRPLICMTTICSTEIVFKIQVLFCTAYKYIWVRKVTAIKYIQKVYCLSIDVHCLRPYLSCSASLKVLTPSEERRHIRCLMNNFILIFTPPSVSLNP